MSEGQLQTEEEISPEQQAWMDSMSGKHALEVLTRHVREAGIDIKAKDVWKHHTRKNIEAGVHAAYDLIGGLPAFALWAHENRGDFYRQYMKLAPAETMMPVATLSAPIQS